MTKLQADIPEHNAVGLVMDIQITACSVSSYENCLTKDVSAITAPASALRRRKFKSGLSLAEKFRARITITPTCWLWNGALDAYGYGQIAVPGSFPQQNVKTHRLAWTLAHGPVPRDMHVLHKCDVRNCVNPDHLFLGDQAVNMKDAAAKGRLSVPRPTLRGRQFSAAHRAALAAAARRRHAKTRRQVA